MKYNDNEKFTKELCDNLYEILGIGKRATTKFMEIISKAIVHKVAEEALDKEDGRLNNFTIQIPHIAKLDLKYNIDGNDFSVTNVELEDKFSGFLRDAIFEGKSPLVADAEKAVVNSINKRYNSLI